MTAAAPTGGKARRTYENLLEAICREIAATGSFTAERVAARAGSSPATFYTYFPSKDDALTAAFGSVLDGLVDWVEGVLTIERLLELGLTRFCDEFVRGAIGFFDGESLIFRVALAQLPESRGLRAAYRASESAVCQRYQRFIELGQSAGKIGDGDAETLARAMLVITQGLNNPIALGLDDGDPLLSELGGTLARLLAPRPSG